MKKLKKWQLFSIIGVAVVVVLGAISAMVLSNLSSTTEPKEVAPIVQQAKEGSIASSVLLTGTVTANSEQYVYYDATKGDLESVLVNVGDQVAVGQALVQYKSTEAQANYDAAVRAVNKADRQINDLQTNGAPAKYDIRTWSPDHSKMGKGITLSNEEFQVLLDAFKNG